MKTRITAVLCLILTFAIGVCQSWGLAAVVATVAGASLMPVSRNAGFAFAAGPLNLLDIALRSGKGVHAVIEGVTTYAPELMTLPALTKNGLEYSTLTCTVLPSGDFAKVGAGVALQKSEWKREKGSMAKFGCEMRVPEDVLIAARAEQADLTDGDVLASEAIRHMRGSAIKIGSAIWYGTKISSDSFAGLSTQVNTAKFEINAGGATNTDTSSVYLVYMDANPVNPEGVHLAIGNGGQMQFGSQWNKQQVEITTGKFGQVFTNGFTSYLGLVVPREEIVLRVKNVKSGNVFTDAVGINLKSLIPIGLRGDLSKWRFFMNSTVHNLLHQSRVTAAAAIGQTYVPEPVDVAGIKIVLTDSLVATERNGLMP